MVKSSKNALTFVFITMLIDVTGIGIIIPGIPDLLKSLGATSIANASLEGGWLMFAYSIMQFFFSPILGGLSDQFGRRPVILASLFGFGIDYLFTAFAPTIFWLFIGRIFAGIFGASFATAGAYIADVSTPEKRAQNFGLIGAAFGLGFIIGPLLGSLLAPYGTKAPFFVAAALSLLNLIYGYFVLPESLDPKNKRTFEWKRANPFGTLKRVFSYPGIFWFLIAFALIMVAGYAPQTIWVYYAREKFGWSTTQVGYTMVAVGLSAAIVQGWLSRYLIPWLGNKSSIMLGMIFWMLGYFGYAIATEAWHIYVFIAVASVGGIASASLQGYLSNLVPANAQGELRGGITSIMSVTAIFGPILMSQVFSRFAEKGTDYYLPGAPFYLGTIIILVSLVILYIVLSKPVSTQNITEQS